MSTEESANILNAWILTENKIVTYKLLSRLLRIKVNNAKQLMAEWHSQNPSVHATYVLCGKNIIKSSPETPVTPQTSSLNQQSSSGIFQMDPQQICSRVIRLVSQEDLEEVKRTYQEITSCHIYSLESSRLKDISVVSSVQDDIKAAMCGQSTKILDLANTYGLIYNAAVHELDQNPKKRKLPDYEVKPIIKNDTLKAPQTIQKEPSNASTSSSVVNTDSKPEKKIPALKRNASSSLASAFAKTQKPKAKAEPSNISVTTPPVETIQKPSTVAVESRASRSESKDQRQKREEENRALKEMMMQEDDNDDEKVTENPSIAVVDKADEIMLDAADWSASDTEMTELKPVISEAVPKRTKKRVKKQVHTTDAKGYMVTTEEWDWVSCDEDDAPAVPAPTRETSLKSAMPAKAKPIPKKKSTSQAGIASFFAKKT